MAELKKYINVSDSKEVRLFDDNFSHKRWKKICKIQVYLA